MNTSLCVSVVDEEVEEHHADDGQRHAKVSERAPDGPTEVLAVPEGREWTNQSHDSSDKLANRPLLEVAVLMVFWDCLELYDYSIPSDLIG